MRADPPEVVADFDVMNPALPDLPPVTLTALVADPADERRLAWRMLACPPVQDRRCDEGDPRLDLGSGVTDDPDSTSPTISADLAVTPELLRASLAGDQEGLGFGGLQIMVELTVWPEGGQSTDGVVASKRVLYAPRIPAERTANTNPTADAIVTDETEPYDDEMLLLEGGPCADAAVVPRALEAQKKIRLEPVETMGVRETYVLPTLDGGARAITENLRYAWFATAGSFSADQTGGPVDFFGNDPPLHTYFTAPEEPGPVDLWMVQRDERGGTSWQRRCFDVQAP